MSFNSRWSPKGPAVKPERATANQSDEIGDRQPEEWNGPSYARHEKAPAGWVIPDLASRPELIAGYRKMRDWEPGNRLQRDQQRMAAQILRQVEDYLGEAV